MAPNMFSMSHNNGVVTKFKGELVFKFKFKKFPPNVNDGSVGGQNLAPHLINPLVRSPKNIPYINIMCHLCGDL
jgi:hypothetical protein